MYLVHEIENFVKSELSCPTKDQYFIIWYVLANKNTTNFPNSPITFVWPMADENKKELNCLDKRISKDS